MCVLLIDLRTTSSYAWCCKKETKGRCFGTMCNCDGKTTKSYMRAVTAPKIKVISKGGKYTPASQPQAIAKFWSGWTLIQDFAWGQYFIEGRY